MKTSRRTLSRERINSLGRLELTAILIDRRILVDRRGRVDENDRATVTLADLRALVIRICHG